MTKRAVIDLSRPILVTMEAFSHFKNDGICSDDGRTFDATLINCDVVSRNKTFYPLDDVLQSMLDRRVQEKLENKNFYSEAEHPSQDTDEAVSLKRLMRVEPSRWAARIDSYRPVGSDICGTVQWAGPFGDIYQKEFVNGGANFAFSIRAYTPNYIEKMDGPNGKYVIKKHLMFIASYDVVTLPGLGGARIMNPQRYAALSKNDILSVKDKGSSLIRTGESFSEISFKDPVNEIRDMLRTAESANFVRDIFGLDTDSAEMIIRDRNTLSVRTSEGLSLELPLSRTLLSEVL